MDKFKEGVAKVLRTWVAIGLSLVALSASDLIEIPLSLVQLFSQDTADIIASTIDAILAAYGSVIALWQVIRGYFATQKPDEGEEALAKSVEEFKGAWKLL